mgnify:CR=1 FL=1
MFHISRNFLGTIMVVDSVCRFRNFEQLHRNLRDLHQYNLQLPPKRILSSSLDDAFVRDRCILLDKYLKVSVKCFQFLITTYIENWVSFLHIVR